MIRTIDVTTQVETTREPTASEQATWDAGKAEQIANAPYREIARLESTITPRRLRDALANDAGKKWVADVEALIATERGKL